MNEMLETLGRNAKEAEIVLRNLDTAKKNQGSGGCCRQPCCRFESTSYSKCH